MNKPRRQFTPEEKFSILQEAEKDGQTEVGRKYNIALSVLAYWKKKYLAKGKEGLKAGYKRIDPHVKELEAENQRLKKIIANQALEIEFKDELIKKVGAHWQNGRKSR